MPERPTRWAKWYQPSLTPLHEGKYTGECVQLHCQWFNQSYLCNETPVKILDTKVQRCFLVEEKIDVPRGWCPLIPWEKAWKLSVWDPPQLHPMWRTRLVLICILSKKAVILSIHLSCITWVVLVNYESFRACGDLWIYSNLVRSAGGKGNLEFTTGIWSTGSLVGDCALNLESALTPGG